MVSQCANPGCSAPFHYLRDGKVFQLQIRQGQTSEPQLVSRSKAPARVEHFWLCADCAASVTLLVDDGRVVAVPRGQAQSRRAAAS